MINENVLNSKEKIRWFIGAEQNTEELGRTYLCSFGTEGLECSASMVEILANQGIVDAINMSARANMHRNVQVEKVIVPKDLLSDEHREFLSEYYKLKAIELIDSQRKKLLGKLA